MSRVSDFPALDLMSLLRDQGMICSVMFRGDSDYQCTHYYADVPGFNREVGNVCGDDRGKLGKVGEDRME